MDNKEMSLKRYIGELTSVKELSFYFLFIWTLILMALSWLDFFLLQFALSELMVTSYLVLLGFYIVHKEASRWAGVQLRLRSGELLVYAWWISLLLMVVISFFTGLEVSHATTFLSYEVLVAFLVSQISKSFKIYRLNREECAKENKIKKENKKINPIRHPAVKAKIAHATAVGTAAKLAHKVEKETLVKKV